MRRGTAAPTRAPLCVTDFLRMHRPFEAAQQTSTFPGWNSSASCSAASPTTSPAPDMRLAYLFFPRFPVQRRVLEQGGECEGILAEQLGKRGRGGVGEKGRSMTP